MRTFIPILLFITLLSCGDKARQENQKTVNPISFGEYMAAIPEVNLPYTSHCDGQYINRPDIDENLISKYASEGESPYRKIPNELDLSITINIVAHDIMLPILKIYDNEGNLKTSQPLFFNFCGEEPGFYSKAQFTISPDLSIMHIDSLKTFKTDPEHKEIEGTAKFEIEKTTFTILKNGTIKKTIVPMIIPDNVDTSFNNFLKFFNSDSTFQVSRVAFPIQMTALNDELTEFETKTITAFDYKSIDLSYDPEIAKRDVDAYTQETILKENTATIQIRGIDNGIHCDFTFEKRDGKWLLITWTNAST